MVVIPGHIVKEGDAVIFITGAAATVIVLVAVDVHPLALVTVKVYPVLVVGLIVMELVVAPVLQLYTVPPTDELVRVALCPLQIVNDGETVMLAVGIGFTVTVFVTVAEHPFVTVTIYPVLTVGVTVMEVVVAPVLHL